MTSARHPSSWEVKAERSEVQGNPWLYMEVKSGFGYVRPSLKRRGKEVGDREKFLKVIIFTKCGNISQHSGSAVQG